MKTNPGWQILLALAGFGLVLALLSYQARSAALCTVTEPAAGGNLLEGMVGAPRSLNPLLSDGNPVDRDLVSLVFDGLTRSDESGRLVPALARSWQVSEDGLDIIFTLRDDIFWHDGEPVTADDVAFTYGLMQSDDFPGPAGLRTLWQAVTITVADPLTVRFTLTQPFAPFLSATTRGLLPAHRLEGVTAATLADHPFNRAPIGTGPFVVEPNQAPRLTGRLRLHPNPLAWRQGTQIEQLEFRFYPDEERLLAAFAAGELHAIHAVSPVMLPAVLALPQARLFTAPAPRYTELLFNLSAAGAPAVQQVAVRRALAHALDREQLLDQVLNGQGVPLEGPYLPRSWAYNPTLVTPYPPDAGAAAALLDEAGWQLPDAGQVRQQAGETLSLRLLHLDAPTHTALARAVAAQWAATGVAASLVAAPDREALQQALAAREFDVVLLEITPPQDPDLYDFWSQEAIVRGQNYAGWNNRRASEALEQARQTYPRAERQPLYDTFLRLYNEALPALTLFQEVDTYALSSEVHNAEVGRIDGPRERYDTLADWFLLYREVTGLCPANVTPTAEMDVSSPTVRFPQT